jgi:hypothetical protein
MRAPVFADKEKWASSISNPGSFAPLPDASGVSSKALF